MRSTNKFGIRYLIPVVLLSALMFCTSKKDTRNKPEAQLVSEISNNKQVTENNTTRKPITSNDDFSLLLRARYPNAVNIDTIRKLFTYEFQELLKKSSNMTFIKMGRINDVEEYKGKQIITIERRNVIGRFLIDSQNWPEFVKDISTLKGQARRGNFVVKITSIIPVHSEININIDDFSMPIDDAIDSENDHIDIPGNDLQDYVHLSLDPTNRPYYIFYGVLIEYHFL
jgi:hypothetical protein